ncbi:MAG: hypothetical protein ACHQIM_03550 [Sphingobacteriales bacterium]
MALVSLLNNTAESNATSKQGATPLNLKRGTGRPGLQPMHPYSGDDFNKYAL